MDKKNNKPKAFWLLRIFGGKWQFLTIPLLSILFSLIAISIVVLLIGKNPLTTVTSLLQGSGWLPKATYAAHKSMFTDFTEFLDAMTPMLFASLAVIVAFKAGLFNIGVSGQMLLAGFMATIFIGYSSLPSALAWPLVILVGIVMGAIVGGFTGFLKYRFNINEVVTSIMLNYIIQYVVSFFINTRYVDAVSRQSRAINPAARLTIVNFEANDLRFRIPLCFVVAILAAFLIYLLFSKSRQGYEIKAVGLNPKAAKYAGISVGKNILLGMTLSGALAGLAGVTYYLGYYNTIQPNTLASMGFDSIAVALLGNSHPLGAIFSSTLIVTLTKGSTYMSSIVGVRQEIASLITGMILLFSACRAYIKYKVDLKLSTSQAKGSERGKV